MRRAKRHLTYSVAETARTFDVTLTTVSHWVKAGLSPIDGKHPYLFSGVELARFLTSRNKPRQPSGPGEMFCVACKRTVTPRDDVVDLVRLSPTRGQFIGTCPHCGRRPHRHVRLAEAEEKAGHLTIRYQEADTPLAQVRDPSHTALSGGAAE